MSKGRYKIKNACWARSEQCSMSLTKEHVVSNSILKYFGPIKFKDDLNELNLGAGSYVIKALCEHHNRKLSKFDDEALKFFTCIDRMSKNIEHPDIKENGIGQKLLNIDGRLLEKWFAKTIFNALLFESKAFKASNMPFFPSPRHILSQLFDDKDFDDPFGLYIGNPYTPLFNNRHSWQMAMHCREIDYFHSDVKRWEKLDVPIFYYTTCIGIEIVGFFNVTSHPLPIYDYFFDYYAKLLKERCIYRPERFGFSEAAKAGYGNQGPACIINFEW